MPRTKKLKVAVLMGGPSQEHEVSLSTGKQILENLDKRKYIAKPVVVTKTGQWLISTAQQKFLGEGGDTKVLALDENSALKKFSQEKPDVAFIAMHGTYGEDGTVQGILEALGLPYTGSGVLASALGMDKPRSSGLFREAGLLVPKFEVVSKNDLKNYRGSTSIIISTAKRLDWPIVVKPVNHGSSVGVSIAKNKKELLGGMKDAFKYSKRVILQKFIKGRELTCGVLENKTGKLLPLPVTEILPVAGKFYDYKSKYADGGSRHIIPPPGLSAKIIKKIQDSACLAHNVLGCSGMSRSDFILDQENKLYILEINTIPGMTATSLLPEAAKKMGIDFPKLLDIIIKNALQKHREDRNDYLERDSYTRVV